MPHAAREDAPDTWHHVFNRGVARRPVFEARSDVRLFLSLLARGVRSGKLEVHAYCVMTTHFHLLVRSPVGRMSDAMQRIESGYARWYNRGRRRDGPLFRGPFRSRRVKSDAHWRAALTYIDRNPVDAHMVPLPAEYPWGSARHYAQLRGPPWLCRTRVEAVVQDMASQDTFEPARYDATVAAFTSPTVADWVERSLRTRSAPAPELDHLVAAAPGAVREWMRRKMELADGTAENVTIVGMGTVLESIAREQQARRAWVVRVGRYRRSAWAAMRVGLLRDAAAVRIADVARHERIGASSACRRYEWHVAAMRTDPEYTTVVARIIADALARAFGTELGSIPPPSRQAVGTCEDQSRGEGGECVPGSVPPTSRGR